MTITHYPIMHYSELTPEQQEGFAGDQSYEESSYIVVNKSFVIPLADTLRIKDGYWHGSYGISNTLGYMVRLADDNESAIIQLTS